jgi:hypothetical protein
MTQPANPFNAAPGIDPLAQPAAYLVRVPNLTPAVFLDCGRAMAYAAQYHGQVVPLFEAAG